MLTHPLIIRHFIIHSEHGAFRIGGKTFATLGKIVNYYKEFPLYYEMDTSTGTKVGRTLGMPFLKDKPRGTADGDEDGTERYELEIQYTFNQPQGGMTVQDIDLKRERDKQGGLTIQDIPGPEPCTCDGCNCCCCKINRIDLGPMPQLHEPEKQLGRGEKPPAWDTAYPTDYVQPTVTQYYTSNS